ncbi:hypothetical protein BDR06DRAFT_950107 [Suillus hirtellus]|nr:hypothetical protein BDR06DRAFT_950107 [Suillus hirtellus]
MEDRQPNEVRLDRKGKSTVPAITVTRRGGHRGSFRGFDSSRGRPPYRTFNQRNLTPHSTLSPAWDHSNKFSSASSSSNTPGRSLDQVKQEPLGHLEQSDSRLPKRIKRRELPYTNIPLPSQCPKVILRDHEAQAVFSPYKAMHNDRSVPRKLSQGE